MTTKIREVKPRYGKSVTLNEQITMPEQIADIFRKIVKQDMDLQEHVLAFHLNGNHQVIGYRLVTIGLLNQCQIHPREVYQSAILDSCASIIVAHNHPSGDLTPSQQDIDITKRLQKAGEIIGIKLIDHLIVTKKESYSFKEYGLI